MFPKVTSDILEAYLACPFKGHLKLADEQGNTSDYMAMLSDVRAEVRQQAIDKLLSQQQEDGVERGIALTPAVLVRGAAYILDAVLEDNCFRLRFDGLKRVDEPSQLGPFHYIPVLFHESRHLRKEQKLLLSLYGALVAGLQGKRPEFGIIWHGKDCRASKFRLKASEHEIECLLDTLREMQAGASQPPLILNDHCPVCEFRHRCRSQAMNDDNLSLLRGISAKEIRSYTRKGIFTLGQLSHTFRPRRKGKRAKPGSHKRHHSLQAMAIRDKTIYVLGSPELPSSPVQVYFDIEADPEEGFVHLIGLIIVDGAAEKRFSFWANSKQDERAIFEQFLGVLSKYKDFLLFAYGSYEGAFLKRMQKQPELKGKVDGVLKASVNILSVIYAHIYFPTYGNGLKEIGSCLGCNWTEPDASGLQSIFWRAKWAATHDESWKQKLLQYNLEDCTALKTVTDQVYGLVAESDPKAEATRPASGPFRVASVHEFDQQARTRKWGAVNFVHSDFAYINGCAYFNYQRQRVYVQTNRKQRRKQAKPIGYRKRRLKATRQVTVLASKCESCNSTDVITTEKPPTGKRRPRVKRAFDLVGVTGGVKLGVIECRSTYHLCRTCRAIFLPHDYRRLARYFHGVKSWAMYQHVRHGLSFGTIREMLDVFFDLPVLKAELHRFKAETAQYYEATYRYLMQKLLGGNLLHVDETQIRLKGGITAYVWAFTNLEEVAYIYRPNREGEFLRDLLKDFHGVLVSDFYTAYDSLDCPQQKCLVHLIRDMNDGLLANPFDEELQAITEPFGTLLRPIVASIGELGLRKWYLRRFKRDVAEYFRLIGALAPRSEVAQSLRDRLFKYQSKLFTFLDHDNVPWNNNNAENAIKRFALYRRNASGMMLDSGVINFLTLLSICQTCKYKGISFWNFLLSRQQLSDGFVERKCRQKSLPLEVYPEGHVTPWEKLVKVYGGNALPKADDDRADK